ncbi:MAG: sensor histidine kinase [Pseudomonadota bacterium]
MPRRADELSLAQRFLIGALIWSVIIVLGGVLATTAVYRAQALNLLEDELDGTLITLSRSLEILPDGQLTSADEGSPPDPRFEIPLSGRYWTIAEVDNAGDSRTLFQSLSVFDDVLKIPASIIDDAVERPGAIVHGDSIGPYLEPIRLSVQAILLLDRERPVLLVVAADRTTTDQGADRLRTILVLAMVALAGGTLIAMWLGLRYALRPLNRIQSDIADVREGRISALKDDYPSEVRPLSEELNKLLEHNKSVVERARTHVGNLAHALKTPLAVLRNEASGDSQLDQTVRRQADFMSNNVQHYLNRAQAAARAQTLGTRSEVRLSADGVARVMNKIHLNQGCHVSVLVPAGLFVAIERQDLDEMLGNLIDNACKWATSKIVIDVLILENGLVQVNVDDDGPGLSQEQQIEAVKRGVRLDEKAPGTGLGLSIVADLADMNGGSLSFDRSPLGGLRAMLTLRRVN